MSILLGYSCHPTKSNPFWAIILRILQATALLAFGILVRFPICALPLQVLLSAVDDPIPSVSVLSQRQQRSLRGKTCAILC